MSGPVWKHETDGSFVCDICLAKTDHAYVEGYVQNAKFRVIRTLCEDCYRNNLHLIQKAS